MRGGTSPLVSFKRKAVATTVGVEVDTCTRYTEGSVERCNLATQGTSTLGSTGQRRSCFKLRYETRSLFDKKTGVPNPPKSS